MHTALQSSIDKVGALSAFDDKEMTWNMKDKNKNAKTEEKTNVMRILDSKKIKYNHYCYVETGETNGEKVAAILGQDPAYVYKTLVTVAKSGANYVFVIPVKEELDLKKAAKAVGEKSIDMLKAKELLPLTGYIHGGCPPIGMKKFFRTTIDASAEDLDKMYVSAGKVGYQIEIAPADLEKVIRLEYVAVTV